jgi:hypothetical protein
MVRQGEPARLLRGRGSGSILTGGFDEARAGPEEKGQAADSENGGFLHDIDLLHFPSVFDAPGFWVHSLTR